MDEMFFRYDGRSLRRGQRRDRRTETCRPCLVWIDGATSRDDAREGVVMDVNPYGLCVRMLEGLEPGTNIRVQLMHDDDFREPMAAPMEGKVVRRMVDGTGFTDHGIELERSDIRREESRPKTLPKRPALPSVVRPKMHTFDVTVGNRRHDRRR